MARRWASVSDRRWELYVPDMPKPRSGREPTVIVISGSPPRYAEVNLASLDAALDLSFWEPAARHAILRLANQCVASRRIAMKWGRSSGRVRRMVGCLLVGELVDDDVLASCQDGDEYLSGMALSSKPARVNRRFDTDPT